MLVFCGIQRFSGLQKPQRASTLGGLNPNIMNRSHKTANSLPGQGARLCKCSACAPFFPPWKPFASFSCTLKESGVPKMLRNPVQRRVSPRSEWSGFAISRDGRKEEAGPALKNVRISLRVYFCGLPSVCLRAHNAHVHMYMWMSEHNRGYLTFFTLLFEVGSLTEPEVCWFGKVGWPHIPDTPPVSLSVLGLQLMPLCLAFGCGFWWSYSSPYVCMANSSPMESLPQTQSFSIVCLIVCDTFKASTYLGQGYTLKQTGEVYL